MSGVGFSRRLVEGFGFVSPSGSGGGDDGLGVLCVGSMRRELCAFWGVEVEREALRRMREGGGDCVEAGG